MSKGMQRSYVNAGGLFFFSDTVSSVFEDDVLTSNLAFQINASIKHDKFDEGRAWCRMYLEAMTTFGYLPVGNDVQSIPVEAPDSVWGVVKHELNRWVSPVLIEQAETVIQFHQDNARALALFREHAMQDQSASQCEESTVSMQLAFVEKEPLLTLVFLSFNTTHSAQGLPFPLLLKQKQVTSNLALTIVTTSLEDSDYAPYRQGFLARLGARRETLIIGLDELVP